jgi:large subunit ribosomal protein L10
LAISKARKEELVAEYTNLINQSKAIFLAEYGGMSVKSLEGLRNEVRKVNGSFYVTKNTLLIYSLQQANRPVPEELLLGQVATGFALDEVPAMAKTLVDYARTQEFMKLKGGILGDKILSAEQIEALANLPPLDQLRAQIIGLINAPAQGIVSALTNGVRQVVNVLDAYAKSEEAAEAA